MLTNQNNKNQNLMTKRNIEPFIRPQRLKKLLMIVILFELIYSAGQSTQLIGKGLGWIIDSVLDYDINHSKYKL